ncbi:hypothetical protein DB347_23405 [Opitutaceae bacterium EW11]|nr:hypothetical protein DB347_23405 [Opitutaceae bacterium EW11]
MSTANTPLQQAVAFHRAGRLEEAAALYRKILESNPRESDALHLLGIIALDRGDAAEAESFFARACDVLPKVAPYRLNRARALRALGRLDQAEHELRQAIALQPALAEAHQLLGNILKAQRRYADAVPFLRESARLTPQDAVAWLNLGVACLELEQEQDALAAFRRAVELAPGRADAWNVLGHALFTFGQATEARKALEKAISLQPSYPAAHDNLGRVARAQGEPDEAVREFRAAMAGNQHAGTQSNLLFALHFSPQLTPERIAAEHFSWASSVPAAVVPLWEERDFSPERKLRVGFVSPDFVHHAVSYFFEPLLRQRPRDAWEAICYSTAKQTDYVTERLKGCSDGWRDISGMDDAAADALVRRDNIDILIDLAGHTANNRLLLFARRPAPLQATWLGYPNTTGLPTIDYRLTDEVSDPTGKTEALHSEKLLRLPRGFSCYLPPEESPSVNPLPALESGVVTFGCFNQFAKVNADVITIWSALLRTLPKARLLLRSQVLGDAPTAEAVRQRFAARGVRPEQLVLSGERLSVEKHLRAYHAVDIALDPFPYNGATTTCEALWMGVPAVTLAGASHVSRVGASFLTQIGAPEWIAPSPDAYIAIAQKLAGDLSALADVRAGLRDRMLRSPLCDAKGFASDFTAVLRQIWRERCGSRS